jgi:hypothetical protein
MAPKLVDKKIRKDTTYAFALHGGVLSGGIKKSSLPPSTSKAPTSPTRSSRRLQKEAPEAVPLHDTWEAFDSKPAEFIKKQSTSTTLEGVLCHMLWKLNNTTSESKLWGFAAERKAEHFYPGQIIRAMDATPQTFYNAPIHGCTQRRARVCKNATHGDPLEDQPRDSLPAIKISVER